MKKNRFKQTREKMERMLELITAKDVQELFDIVHSTYYRWIRKGWLKPTVISRRHYYRIEDILALVEKRNGRERGGLD